MVRSIGAAPVRAPGACVRLTEPPLAVRNAVDDYCNDAIDSLEAALLQVPAPLPRSVSILMRVLREQSLSRTMAGDELERARVTVAQVSRGCGWPSSTRLRARVHNGK